MSNGDDKNSLNLMDNIVLGIALYFSSNLSNSIENVFILASKI